MIMMNSQSQLTVDVIAKVAQGKISILNASKLLNKSSRTIERYLSRYKKDGIRFVVHGNTGKTPTNKIPDSLKRQVQSLIKEKYYDFNLLHLADILRFREGIQVKRETLRSWAHAIHHVKRAKHRRSKVRRRRERMESSGLMLQMDGSPHQWFGHNKSCLIAIIDDATSDIHAEFFPSETTEGCMKVMKAYIEKRGLFKTLYVDRAGIFGGPKRCNFSQMQRACEELGIEIIFANSPQGKGRVERAFDTFQDRLVPELRLAEIMDMDSANDYLQSIFIPDYWLKKLTVHAKNIRSEFKPVPEHINLDAICVQKEYRKIRRDHTFSYNNTMYLIDSPLRHSIVNHKVEIRKQLDGNFSAYFADRKLSIAEIKESCKLTECGEEVQKKLDAIKLAEELGNLSEAARISGCSRESIYNNRRLLETQGPLALKRMYGIPRHTNRIDQDTEDKVIALTLEKPSLTQIFISSEMMKRHKISISHSTIRNIWVREKLNTKVLRIERSEALANTP
ncbi:ISNCY family transposase [Shewanella sp. GutCb]|uniref:ISNCY family transposase n=1 Tax=Shewanella sp. GutCb TaxID=2058315 RepID=UPI000C79C66A|nr:ISNCY family transposase [Shewanella sp. GutCb]PKG76561.1 ISNCY family transposase [Shewanella sp. GutCb]